MGLLDKLRPDNSDRAHYWQVVDVDRDGDEPTAIMQAWVRSVDHVVPINEFRRVPLDKLNVTEGEL